MAIEIQQKQVAKEVADIGVFIIGIVHDIKSGKPVAEIAAGNLASLVAAVQGAQAIPEDEIKANRKVALQTIGSFAGELIDTLLPVA